MAPRRGGGGGGGSITLSSCPGFLQLYPAVQIPRFVDYCLFLVLDIVVLIAMIKVKKRHPSSKKTLGWAFGLSLTLNILGYILLVIANVLTECNVTTSYQYYDIAIAYMIFFDLSYYFLLVVMVLYINQHMREPIGAPTMSYKIFYWVSLGFMGLLTLPRVAIDSYNSWTSSIPSSYNYFTESYDSGPKDLYRVWNQLDVAYQVFYMLIVFLSGVGMIGSIKQLKERGIPAQGLTGSVVFLMVTILGFFIFYIAPTAAYLQNTTLGINTNLAFMYLSDFFHLATFIAIICIARQAALNNWTNQQDQAAQFVYAAPPAFNGGASAPMAYNGKEVAAQQYPVYAQPGTMPQQQQYQYVAQANGQPYYFQQQPQQQPQQFQQQPQQFQQQHQQFQQQHQQGPIYNNGTPVPTSGQAPELQAK